MGVSVSRFVGETLQQRMQELRVYNEAMRTFLEQRPFKFAFIDRRRHLGSVELTADVDPRNLTSIRLLERHGFMEVGRAKGTWQVGEELCDSIYYRLEL